MNAKIHKTILSLTALAVLLAGAAAPARAESEERLVAASRLVDRDVYDGKGELIGEVQDLIIRRSGRVKKLIVEYGGIVGIGDKLVSLNFKRFSLEKNGVHLDFTAGQLDGRPEFDYYREGLRPEYYYYAARPYAVPYSYPPAGYSFESGKQPGRRMPAEQWAFSSPRFLASVVMNRYLLGSEGKSIGWVEDLLIDMASGTVEKIVVAAGGVLTEDGLKALPYRALGFSAYGIVYDASSDDLVKMPEYTRSD